MKSKAARISEPAAIEVHRHSGVYEIPGGASPENSSEINESAVTIEPYGELSGWGTWASVYRVEDQDGLVRWYFAGPWPSIRLAEIPAPRCLGCGDRMREEG